MVAEPQQLRSGAIPWAITGRALLPFALGYFISYLFRAVNQVIAPDLIGEFNLTQGELGRLTSAYLLGFVLFQLPLGMLLDRFGPRRVQVGLLAVAGCGAALFAMAQDAWTLTIARGILGLGLCGCLMSAFKANAIWLPIERIPLANSLTIAIGALGVVTATVPADLVAQSIGWRGLFWILVALTGLVCALIFLSVPERGGSRTSASWSGQFAVLRRIFSDGVFWRVAPMVATISGSYIAIQTLWAGRWLTDVAALSRQSTAEVLLAMATGFVIGSVTTGLIADIAGRHGIRLQVVIAGTLSVFAAAQLLIVLEAPVSPYLPWFLFGFAGQAANLGYATLAEHFGPDLAGRAQTAANLLLFAGATFFQWGIGVVLDFFPAAELGSAQPIGYRLALGIVLALQLLTLGWYLLGRRTAVAKAA